MIEKIVPCTIAIILVGTLLAPIINDYIKDSNPYKTDAWYFDDYREMGTAESCTGSLELVTLSDKKYVHANNVGEGTITHNDGTVESVNVSKAKLDVFLALGQSNNAYVRYDPATAEPVPEIGTAYYYGYASGPISGTSSSPTEGDMQPMVTVPGTAAIGDKAPSFCAEYYAHTYHKVYYITGAYVGSTIQEWQPGEDCWNIAKTILGSAMSCVDTDLYEVSTMGYTWIQGESNRNTAIDTYKELFVDMHDAILSGELGEDFNHCFISLVKKSETNPAIAQKEIADEYNTVTLVTQIADTFTIENGMMASDDLHYSQLGDNVIGSLLGEGCAQYYYPLTPTNNGFASTLAIVPLFAIVALLIWLIPKRSD